MTGPQGAGVARVQADISCRAAPSGAAPQRDVGPAPRRPGTPPAPEDVFARGKVRRHRRALGRCAQQKKRPRFSRPLQISGLFGQAGVGGRLSDHAPLPSGVALNYAYARPSRCASERWYGAVRLFRSPLRWSQASLPL